MRPFIVTMASGEKRRINPLALSGWHSAQVPIPPMQEGANAPVVAIQGTSLIFQAGPIGVRESVETVDWLFEYATCADPLEFMPLGPVGMNNSPEQARRPLRRARGATTS